MAVMERHVDELPLLVRDLTQTQMLEGSGFDTKGVFAVIRVQPAESVERLYWLKILDDRTQESITVRRPLAEEELGLYVMRTTGHGDDRVFEKFFWNVKDAPAQPWPALRVLKGAHERKPAKKRRRSR